MIEPKVITELLSIVKFSKYTKANYYYQNCRTESIFVHRGNNDFIRPYNVYLDETTSIIGFSYMLWEKINEIIDIGLPKRSFFYDYSSKKNQLVGFKMDGSEAKFMHIPICEDKITIQVQQDWFSKIMDKLRAIATNGELWIPPSAKA